MSDLFKSISESEPVEKESVVDLKKNKLKRKLLQHLYTHGSFTIAQLTKHLHTSVPSVTSLIEELMKEKWIVEIGPAEVQLGRKPALYRLNPHDRYVLAIDMNTYSSKAYLLNLHNEVIFSQAISVVIENKPIIESLTQEIVAVLQAAACKITELEAISISMPGLINPKTGINYTYPHLCSKGKSLPFELEKSLHIPTYVIHDTKAIILGEHHFGLAQNIQHAITVNMDWNGVGFGLLVNGQVVLGESGFAGELAHIQVRPQGELCYCGKVGCLDTVTKASYLVKRIKELIKEGNVSLLANEDFEKIDIEMVIDASNRGDELAIDLLQDMGHEMGKVLAIAVHLLNPKTIIIHGVLAHAGKFISNPIEQAIYKYCLADYKENLSVEISELGEKAKVLGLQAYAIHKTLAENN
ncbi:ROK family transcriptional regulator [Aquirufa ecclesiirivi]|uniref:ROK family transcriptional regulator n=1 Tax=Aquirufa ecclesiirivi TaxID=2715124 RepID=A0ABT4JJA1_9BACT|nr:ROK family transcriptional regulator [Aquirufa ecclesiirivi]MCZ2476362.1 ROK family transcriptional regulator [Aquirufa ecclesiirivi]